EALDLLAALHAAVEVLARERGPDRADAAEREADGEVERHVRRARPRRDLGALDDADVGGGQLGVDRGLDLLLPERLVQIAGALRVAAEDRVARADLAEGDGVVLLSRDLLPQLLLPEDRGVVPVPDRGDLLLHLGAQLGVELGFLLTELDDLRM